MPALIAAAGWRYVEFFLRCLGGRSTAATDGVDVRPGERFSHFCDFSDDRLRRRTPGPPPFSSMNSTPARSNAVRIFLPVPLRPPRGPSLASSLLIVGSETSAVSANCSCDQATSARAALTCRIDTFSIDFGAISIDTFSIKMRFGSSTGGNINVSRITTAWQPYAG